MYAEGARRQVTHPLRGQQQWPLSISSTSDTYLTHTVEGTGEAVVGNGCVPGFDWPHGLTEKGVRTKHTVDSLATLRRLGSKMQPGFEQSCHGTNLALGRLRREVSELETSPGYTGRTGSS